MKEYKIWLKDGEEYGISGLHKINKENGSLEIYVDGDKFLVFNKEHWVSFCIYTIKKKRKRK